MKSVRVWLGRRDAAVPAPGGLAAVALGDDSDPLSSFGSEARDPRTARKLSAVPAQPRDPDPESNPDPKTPSGWPKWLLIAAGLAALVQAPFAVMWMLQWQTDLFAKEGAVFIETSPEGVDVWSEGKSVGRTPLQLSLAEGERVVELRYGSQVRTVPITVSPGTIVRQRVEFAPDPVRAAAEGVTGGTIQIATEPARALISVDGTARGASPLTIENLPAGLHSVSVRFATGSVDRQIRVEAGSTASFVITMPQPSGALSGWLDIDAPATLQILEDGRLLGTTDVDRLMLPVGQHTLDLVSDELGYRVQRSVAVKAGETAAVKVELPRGSLSINAQPWANVWVDGERVGETPIGNLSRAIGPHEIIFRHPTLGERRASVVITLKEPARIGVDLRRGN